MIPAQRRRAASTGTLTLTIAAVARPEPEAGQGAVHHPRALLARPAQLSTPGTVPMRDRWHRVISPLSSAALDRSRGRRSRCCCHLSGPGQDLVGGTRWRRAKARGRPSRGQRTRIRCGRRSATDLDRFSSSLRKLRMPATPLETARRSSLLRLVTNRRPVLADGTAPNLHAILPEPELACASSPP